MSQRFCLTTKELCSDLPYSERTLFRLRKEEILAPGQHFILRGLGTNKPSILWDPIAVEETLQKRSRRLLKK